MSISPSEHRVIWITGAAGGLGRRLVDAFSKEHWRVVATYREDSEQLETEAVWPMKMNVIDAGGVEATVGQILERWGRLDVLINNAGIVDDHLAWQITPEDWDRVLDTNLKGAFLCSKAAVRPMMKQREGHIINISSFAARNGHHGQASYVAAKAGMIGLTESLAKEVGSRNVRVNAVMPGVLPTRMTAHLTEERLKELASLNTLNRLNDPDEVAQFIVFLACMKNVSGQIFQLDSRVGPWT